MMTRFRIMMIALIIAVVATASSQATNSRGTTPLFNFGAGGRGLGMGGANVALANDASAIFWNPATLTNLQDRSLSVMHLPLPEGTNYDFAAFGWPTVDYGTFSLGAFLLTTGDIERRDASGRLLGTFSANQQLFLVGYGKQINRFLSLGATIKMYGESFDNSSAFGAGGDFGLKLALTDNLVLGLNAQNILAPEIRVDRDAETLPINFKAGAGFVLPISEGRHRLSLEADVDKSENVDPVFHVGGEFAFLNQYFLRAGYDVDQINLGAGLRFKFVTVGYTFRTQDNFDAQHRLSMDITFGGSIESILAQREKDKRDAAVQLAKEARERDLSVALAQARSYYESGIYDSAAVYYQRVEALTNNSDTEAANRLAEIEKQRTQELTATVRAGVLAESDSIKAAELFSDLDEAVAVKDLESANLMLERLRPAFGADNRFKKSETEYLRLTSNRISTLRGEAARLANEGKLTEAAQRHGDILKLNPSDVGARRGLTQINNRISALEMVHSGVAAYNSGDTTQARTLFERAIAVNPDDSVAQAMLDRFQSGSKPLGVPLTEVQKDPASWKLYLDGIEKFRSGEYQEAIRLWEQVLQRYPGNPETEKNIQQAKLRLQTNGKTN
jgi:tetratricopeptide (TPR) repeat protein